MFTRKLTTMPSSSSRILLFELVRLWDWWMGFVPMERSWQWRWQVPRDEL